MNHYADRHAEQRRRRCPSSVSASSRSPTTRPRPPSRPRSRPATATSTPPPPTATRRPSAPRSPPAASPRDDLFVTTKLWIQHAPTGSVEDDTKRAFDDSLRRLGLDHLDLYLIHQPLGDYYSEWRAMQQLYTEGRIRAIGVSNFHPDRLVDLIDHNEITPGRQPDRDPPLPPARHRPGADARTRRPDRVLGPVRRGPQQPVHRPVLSAIAETHGKSVAQVVLRWLIQRDVVVIPKSVRPDRMAQNLDIFDFTLTDDQMKQIATLDTGASLFFDHRDPAMVSCARRPQDQLTMARTLHGPRSRGSTARVGLVAGLLSRAAILVAAAVRRLRQEPAPGADPRRTKENRPRCASTARRTSRAESPRWPTSPAPARTTTTAAAPGLKVGNTEVVADMIGDAHRMRRPSDRSRRALLRRLRRHRRPQRPRAAPDAPPAIANPLPRSTSTTSFCSAARSGTSAPR